jgi:formate C-acetyltransferase
MSPMQGRDSHGPTAAIRSALKLDQDAYQATLLNLKFHRSALATSDDLRKLASLIRTYLEAGGKHVQFNVVDRATLLDAQLNPDEHRDLVVRIAGYSAYFVTLSRTVQDDIIARTEHACVA